MAERVERTPSSRTDQAFSAVLPCVEHQRIHLRGRRASPSIRRLRRFSSQSATMCSMLVPVAALPLLERNEGVDYPEGPLQA